MKKLLRWSGSIISILCLVFVFKSLLSLDVSKIVQYLSGDGWMWLGLGTLFYCVMPLILPFIWISLLRLIRHDPGFQPPIRLLFLAYIQSNLMKYIPGNIFVFIGRNVLGVRLGYQHGELALASFFEMLFDVFVTLLFSIPLLVSGFGQTQLSLGRLLSGTLFVCLLFSIGIAIASKKARAQGRTLEKKWALKSFLFTTLTLVVAHLISGLLWVGILSWVCHFPVLSPWVWLTLISSMSFAWLIGFITPGAPGGLGVREAILFFAARSLGDSEAVLASILLHRLVSVLGDFLVAGLATLFLKKHRLTPA